MKWRCLDQNIGFLQSTNATHFPVRPPTLLRAPPTPVRALITAGPAVEAALEIPSEAFDAAEVAATLDLEAASAVVDADLKAGLRIRHRDCRQTARDVVVDIWAAGMWGDDRRG